MSPIRLSIMWGSLVAFFAFVMVVRVSPGVMADDIMRHFLINATEFGLLTSLYYLGYSFMQIPIGFLLDRYGPRYIASLGVLLCGAGIFCFAHTECWVTALFARFLIGVGSSGAFISVTKLCRMYFSERWLSPIIGLSVTMGLLAAFGGGKPLSLLSESVGWQTTLTYFSLAALGLVAVIFAIVRTPQPVRDVCTVSGVTELMRTLQAQNILWIAVFGMLLTGPFCAFADVFGVSYFMHTQGWDKAQAAQVTTVIFVGMAVGGPLLGGALKYFHHSLDLVALSGLIMLIAFGSLLVFDVGYVSGLILCFIIGVFCAFQVLVFSISLMKTPVNQGGIMMGIVNCINMISGLMYLPFVGKMLDVFWEGGMMGGIKTYSAWSYKMAMLPILGGLLIGTVGFGVLCLVERRSRR